MAIKGGYILQPRCVDDSEIMHNPPIDRELWFYLLRKVNHSDGKDLKRGQGFFCFEDILDDLHWMVGYRKETYSKPQLTKSMRRLREGNAIATTKATRGIIVTICNYDYYQDPYNYEGNDERNTKETRRKWEGNTINKNDKNVKNDNTHTQSLLKNSPHACARTKGEELMDWLQRSCPAILEMQRTITLSQAEALTSRLPAADITRIFLDICNKGATTNISAIHTFHSFERHDFALKDRRNQGQNKEARIRGYAK